MHFKQRYEPVLRTPKKVCLLFIVVETSLFNNVSFNDFPLRYAKRGGDWKFEICVKLSFNNFQCVLITWPIFGLNSEYLLTKGILWVLSFFLIELWASDTLNWLTLSTCLEIRDDRYLLSRKSVESLSTVFAHLINHRSRLRATKMEQGVFVSRLLKKFSHKQVIMYHHRDIQKDQTFLWINECEFYCLV